MKNLSLTIALFVLFIPAPAMSKTPVKIKQTAGRDQLGEFAPEFARLNDDVLFGEV